MALGKAIVILASLSAVAWLMQAIVSAKGVIPAYAFKNRSVATLSLHSCAVAALPAFVLVFLTMMMRLTSTGSDPMKSEEPTLLMVTKQALTNTFEQTFIFVVNLLAAGTFE